MVLGTPLKPSINFVNCNFVNYDQLFNLQWAIKYTYFTLTVRTIQGDVKLFRQGFTSYNTLLTDILLRVCSKILIL